LIDIKTQIQKYPDHIGDTNYIQSILIALPQADLFALLSELLSSNTQVTVLDTCLFIRDVVNLMPAEVGNLFRLGLFKSPLILTLNDLIVTRNYFVRSNSIYTLGKIGAYKSLPVMQKAFDTLIERDPLIMLRLLSEMRGLYQSRDQWWANIERIASHSHFLIRWSGVEILRHSVAYDFIIQSLTLLAALREDVNPFVRKEAEYHALELQHLEEIRGLPKPQQRAMRKALNLQLPKVAFFNLKHQFSEHLWKSKQADYTLEELDDYRTTQMSG
jgi:HEAT repeat protein